jgi:hypothetical protein
MRGKLTTSPNAHSLAYWIPRFMVLFVKDMALKLPILFPSIPTAQLKVYQIWAI